MIRPFRSIVPAVDPTAYVDVSAQVIGDVHIGAESSVWMNVVIRGDVNAIRIGARTNVQDLTLIHVMRDTHPAHIGDDVTIGHSAIIHGCTIEDACLIGIAATVVDGAVIGRGSIVAGGAFVKEGTIVPPASIVAGVPAKVVRTRDASRENRLNAWLYHRNADHYRRGLHRAWDGPEYEAWLAAKRAEVAADLDL